MELVLQVSSAAKRQRQHSLHRYRLMVSSRWEIFNTKQQALLIFVRSTAPPGAPSRTSLTPFAEIMNTLRAEHLDTLITSEKCPRRTGQQTPVAGASLPLILGAKASCIRVVPQHLPKHAGSSMSYSELVPTEDVQPS
jgi:hypothetical protein